VPHRHLIPRRGFLATAAAGLLNAQSKSFGPAAQRYSDPATELEVVRLTDPAYVSLLPPPQQRSISHRQGFCVFASDRSGPMQVYRMDLKSFEWRLLSNSAAVDPASLTLTPDERSVMFFDGPVLKTVTVGGGAEKTLYRADGVRSSGLSLSSDGAVVAFAEFQDGQSRLRLVGMPRGRSSEGAPRTAAVIDGRVDEVQFRPKHAQLMYRANGALYLSDQQGKSSRLQTRAAAQALWAPGASTLQYLSEPTEQRGLVTLREAAPESGEDKLIGKTSNFAGFSANADSSVFVGASRNQSSLYVLLLLRVTNREFSLCEHRCTKPERVQPRFSPDSQSVLFMSDRHGKMAIYRIKVEKLVEETEVG
jgi:oligogalacturonide lyase